MAWKRGRKGGKDKGKWRKSKKYGAYDETSHGFNEIGKEKSWRNGLRCQRKGSTIRIINK